MGGVAIGLASNLSPMYIAEISPPLMRGRLVSINQLTIVIGVPAAQVINWSLVRGLPAHAADEFIATSWYGQTAWRWMFAVTAAPAILFFLGCSWCRKVPAGLSKTASRKRLVKSSTVLAARTIPAAGLAEIQSTLATEEIQHVRFQDLLDPRLSRVLLLGIVLAVFQQWCGINVIFNYTEEIFKAAGYDISSVMSNIAWTGSVNFAFTLVAFGIVDRAGRRPLMLFGAGSLTVIYAILSICYHGQIRGVAMLLLVLAAIACYSTSLAPVTWVIISEIFPNRIRGAAMSVAVASLWMACFILTYTFPSLNAALGPDGTFLLYAIVCAFGFLFICLKLPETKAKTLEQLETDLVGNSAGKANSGDSAITRVNLQQNLCMANSYSRGDWQIEKPVAMGLPGVILETGRSRGSLGVGHFTRRVSI